MEEPEEVVDLTNDEPPPGAVKEIIVNKNVNLNKNKKNVTPSTPIKNRSASSRINTPSPTLSTSQAFQGPFAAWSKLFKPPVKKKQDNCEDLTHSDDEDVGICFLTPPPEKRKKQKKKKRVILDPNHCNIVAKAHATLKAPSPKRKQHKKLSLIKQKKKTRLNFLPKVDNSPKKRQVIKQKKRLDNYEGSGSEEAAPKEGQTIIVDLPEHGNFTNSFVSFFDCPYNLKINQSQKKLIGEYFKYKKKKTRPQQQRSEAHHRSGPS